MALEKYKAKRKFEKTPEPEGKVGRKGKKRFVIHKHNASHLHYDFRLEADGVLKSWAIPKEPPKIKGIKRLAVQVEDHPIDYLDFEGVIPEGNYGAGKVEIWDRGTYESKVKSLKLKVDSFKFELMGKKLRGEYALVRLNPSTRRFAPRSGPSLRSRGKNWLFFKTK